MALSGGGRRAGARLLGPQLASRPTPQSKARLGRDSGRNAESLRLQRQKARAARSSHGAVRVRFTVSARAHPTLPAPQPHAAQKWGAGPHLVSLSTRAAGDHSCLCPDESNPGCPVQKSVAQLTRYPAIRERAGGKRVEFATCAKWARPRLVALRYRRVFLVKRDGALQRCTAEPQLETSASTHLPTPSPEPRGGAAKVFLELNLKVPGPVGERTLWSTRLGLRTRPGLALWAPRGDIQWLWLSALGAERTPEGRGPGPTPSSPRLSLRE
jgi:hypothetical protein